LSTRDETRETNGCRETNRLILAGRGYGKTRTGAEKCRVRSGSSSNQRILLFARRKNGCLNLLGIRLISPSLNRLRATDRFA
jgi:hypothetical protein